MKKMMMFFVIAMIAGACHSGVVENDKAVVIGAVNWDCSLPSTTYFGHYATTSLGPRKYPTPFYADVKGPDSFDYHMRTVEEYEREMRYAIDAGIDYFAYCWYGDRKDRKDIPAVVSKSDISGTCDEHIWELTHARKLHLQSALRDKLKMCAIIVVLHPLTDSELDSLAATMKENCYQKVKGRPLVYLFGYQKVSAGVITRLRASCRRMGAGDPYVVVMGGGKYSGEGDEGVQALSSYVDMASGVESYPQLMRHGLAANTRRAKSGMKVIPAWTLGWDPSPRIDNPVPWCTYPKKQYARRATEEEMLCAANEMAEWMRANAKSCEAGHLLAFAWNEFEEGGWMCPTLRADGEIDTTRINVFRKAVEIINKSISSGK